jgi:hypothetical protein
LFPYWLLFSLFAVGSIQFRERSPLFGRGTPLLPAAIIFTALMIGLRFEVGADWMNYQEIYSGFEHLELDDAIFVIDPGYAAINWLGSVLGLQIWFVNLICGAIFSWGLLKFAKRQPNPWLCVVVAVPYLIIVVAMGYTRQAVAIGLILGGLSVFGRGSIFRFLAYIVLAAAFHKTALIVVPLAALAVSRQRLLSGAILLVSAPLLYFLFAADSVDLLVQNYVGTQYASQGAAIRIAMNLPPALIFLLFKARFHVTEQERALWTYFSFASFAALAFLLVSPSSAAVDRISLYIIPLQIFVLSRLPETFREGKRTNGQLTLAVIIYSAAIQFVWLNFAVHADGWLPYRVHSYAA